MTELIAHSDAYIKVFKARVTAVNREEGAVALDRTAFYPGGGGQPYDLGWLNHTPVTKVKRQGDEIRHWLDGPLPIEGEEVSGKLDWDRRYKLMRTHTAFHILCGVVWRDYGAQVTGGNLDLLKGRMDFEFETLRQELVREIEEKLNQEVAAARPAGACTRPPGEHCNVYYYSLINSPATASLPSTSASIDLNIS